MDYSINLSLNEKNILNTILLEYFRACALHPIFPSDLIHRSAIISEESGELTQACLQFIYESKSIDNVRTEAIHIAAMAIRFLFELK